jgi:hypothetical protein
VWNLHPVEGCFDTRWLMGLWFTKAEVEGVVLKAAWHWGSDSSDVTTLTSVHLLETFSPPRSLNLKFWHKKSEKYCTGLKTTSCLLSLSKKKVSWRTADVS